LQFSALPERFSSGLTGDAFFFFSPSTLHFIFQVPFRADVPSLYFVQSKCHADCTLHHILKPVHSLRYRTRLHTLGSVFSHSNVPLDADCRQCHAVQTGVYVHA
jgi:hypothetical protein